MLDNWYASHDCMYDKIIGYGVYNDKHFDLKTVFPLLNQDEYTE